MILACSFRYGVQRLPRAIFHPGNYAEKRAFDIRDLLPSNSTRYPALGSDRSDRPCDTPPVAGCAVDELISGIFVSRTFLRQLRVAAQTTSYRELAGDDDSLGEGSGFGTAFQLALGSEAHRTRAR